VLSTLIADSESVGGDERTDVTDLPIADAGRTQRLAMRCSGSRPQATQTADCQPVPFSLDQLLQVKSQFAAGRLRRSRRRVDQVVLQVRDRAVYSRPKDKADGPRT